MSWIEVKNPKIEDLDPKRKYRVKVGETWVDCYLSGMYGHFYSHNEDMKNPFELRDLLALGCPLEAEEVKVPPHCESRVDGEHQPYDSTGYVNVPREWFGKNCFVGQTREDGKWVWEPHGAIDGIYEGEVCDLSRLLNGNSSGVLLMGSDHIGKTFVCIEKKEGYRVALIPTEGQP